MILINVLLFVGIASSVVMLMISGEDAALNQAIRMREADRARTVAQGGELSAITALRRDMADAPTSDDRTEPWAQIGERARAIDGGSFTLEIADAQSRFNINDVRDGQSGPTILLQRIAATAAVPEEVTTRAIEQVRLYGPISEIRPLAAAGIDPAALAPLARLVTALPYRSDINLNAANEAMLALLLANPIQARQLVDRRKARGRLTPDDFRELGIPVPNGAGFTSNLFWVRTTVTIGGTTQRLTSLIARRRDPQGLPSVAVVGRWQGRASPFDLATSG